MSADWLNFFPQSQAAEQCTASLFAQAHTAPAERDVFVNFPDFSLKRASWCLDSPPLYTSSLNLLNVQIYHYPFVGMGPQFTLVKDTKRG